MWPKLQYSIGEILEVIVQLGGDAVNALLHHGVHQAVQLVLGEVEVEPVLHGLDGAGGVVEAGKLRASPETREIIEIDWISDVIEV